MTHYFLDSSALAKRYVVETGTPWVRSIISHRTGNIAIIAHITPVEVVSGTMRRKRDGSISARTARAVRLLVDRHTNREYKIIGLTDPVVQRAEDLLEQHNALYEIKTRNQMNIETFEYQSQLTK